MAFLIQDQMAQVAQAIIPKYTCTGEAAAVTIIVQAKEVYNKLVTIPATSLKHQCFLSVRNGITGSVFFPSLPL